MIFMAHIYIVDESKMEGLRYLEEGSDNDLKLGQLAFATVH